MALIAEELNPIATKPKLGAQTMGASAGHIVIVMDSANVE